MLSEERISEIRNQVAYLARIRKDLPLSTHDHHYEQDCGELLTAYDVLRGENERLRGELLCEQAHIGAWQERAEAAEDNNQRIRRKLTIYRTCLANAKIRAREKLQDSIRNMDAWLKVSHEKNQAEAENEKLRKRILELKAENEDLIDQAGKDEVTFTELIKERNRAEAALAQSREECEKWRSLLLQEQDFCKDRSERVKELKTALSSLRSHLAGGVEVRACGAPVTEDQHFPIFDRQIGMLFKLKPGETEKMLIVREKL